MSSNTFFDMGARDAYASMIPCITKSIAKEGMAHQIRDFAHRYNPAQKEPSDGISARCAGVHHAVGHEYFYSVRERLQRRDEAELRKRWIRCLCIPLRASF